MRIHPSKSYLKLRVITTSLHLTSNDKSRVWNKSIIRFWLTRHFKEIYNRRRKRIFYQSPNQKKRSGTKCPECSMANYHVVQMRNVRWRQIVSIISKEQRYIYSKMYHIEKLSIKCLTYSPKYWRTAIPTVQPTCKLSFFYTMQNHDVSC